MLTSRSCQNSAYSWLGKEAACRGAGKGQRPEPFLCTHVALPLPGLWAPDSRQQHGTEGPYDGKITSSLEDSACGIPVPLRQHHFLLTSDLQVVGSVTSPCLAWFAIRTQLGGVLSWDPDRHTLRYQGPGAPPDGSPTYPVVSDKPWKRERQGNKNPLDALLDYGPNGSHL